MIWRDLLKSGAELLKKHNIEDYQFDSLQLLLINFDGSYSEYCSHMTDDVSEEKKEAYFEMLRQRIRKIPLQYILGKWDFFESEFFVGEGVLIPRPETEELVESCIEIIRQNNIKVVYDLCTGSGCIGLSLAEKFPEISFYLFDYYDDALHYAKKNTEALGVKNVKIIKHNILEAYEEEVPSADLIVSNPPYINSFDIDFLQDEVKKEPLTALDGGEDGLIFYRSIYNLWRSKLNYEGFMAFECGEDQPEKICKIFSAGFLPSIKSDIYGTERFVFLKKVKGDE